MCANNYPADLEGGACPDCGEILHLQQDETPDPDLLNLSKHLKPTPAALPAPAEIEIHIRRDEESGTLWIHEAVLAHLGYYKVDTFDVVEIEGIRYELQGLRKSTGEWWIEGPSSE
jgi:hypothetical protein